MITGPGEVSVVVDLGQSVDDFLENAILHQLQSASTIDEAVGAESADAIAKIVIFNLDLVYEPREQSANMLDRQCVVNELRRK